ncbi:hypothetical protein F5B19DRAFT_476161 [Rostrohypoxylon terebratum]|nr:hypothetical protein F5B19DRAFT_476161 [Rostrohypoxylon terebratum]
MRPVEISDATGELLEKDRLFLLNIANLGHRYFEQIFYRKGTVIQSKAGLSLPNELWTRILELAHTDESRWRLVKVEIVSKTPETLVLHCSQHTFRDSKDLEDDSDVLPAGCLGDEKRVSAFEDYLTRATPESTLEEFGIIEAYLYRFPEPKFIYEVVLDTAAKDRCLYTCLDVPDIIARIEDGRCHFCDGQRWVCPGCTGGHVGDYGDLFMSCGVKLACPLCMGLDLSQRHKDVLDEFYEPGYMGTGAEDPPEWTVMREEVKDRLRHLDYETRFYQRFRG